MNYSAISIRLKIPKMPNRIHAHLFKIKSCFLALLKPWKVYILLPSRRYKWNWGHHPNTESTLPFTYL